MEGTENNTTPPIDAQTVNDALKQANERMTGLAVLGWITAIVFALIKPLIEEREEQWNGITRYLEI